MNKIKLLIVLLLLTFNILNANVLDKQKKVFTTYCWGCHHQSAMAFGPSFITIANKRTIAQIKAHIMSPESMYKTLGYKRNVMPSFANTLSNEELNLIANYILSYKGKK